MMLKKNAIFCAVAGVSLTSLAAHAIAAPSKGKPAAAIDPFTLVSIPVVLETPGKPAVVPAAIVVVPVTPAAMSGFAPPKSGGTPATGIPLPPPPPMGGGGSPPPPSAPVY